MHCRAAQSQIFAARDTPLGAAAAEALAAHLASCPACQLLQSQLAAAATAWQESDARVVVPNAETEWHAVRRKLRHLEAKPTPAFAWARLLRIGASLTAVAAITLLVRSHLEPAAGPTETTVTSQTVALNDDGPWGDFEDHYASTARAEYVETEDEEASPFVYVDDESGWLIVWATDTTGAASG
jgi:predicted anti-sigma-YlaC factor YlaD